MKKYLLALALLAAPLAYAQTTAPAATTPVATVTGTLTYTAPTKNTDGSTITGAITYNLYAAPQGTTPVLVASGLTANPLTFTAPVTQIPYGTTECFAMTSVVATVESSESTPLGCKSFPAPPPPVVVKTPLPPTNVQLVVGTPTAAPAAAPAAPQ